MAVVAVSMAEATSTHCKCNAMRNAKGTQLLASFYEWNVDNFNGMDLILIENFFITHNNRHNTHTHTHIGRAARKNLTRKRTERTNGRFDEIIQRVDYICERALYDHVVSTTCLLCSTVSVISICLSPLSSSSSVSFRYAHFNIEIKLSPRRLMPKILLLVLYLRFYDVFFIRNKSLAALFKKRNWNACLCSLFHSHFHPNSSLPISFHWLDFVRHTIDLARKLVAHSELSHGICCPLCRITRNKSRTKVGSVRERDVWPKWKATLSTHTHTHTNI